MEQRFPPYVHSVVDDAGPQAWPIARQGAFECEFASLANALNVLHGEQRFSKEQFIHDAGLFFQPRWGGTISPMKSWLLKRYGYGTHFGNLSGTAFETVLRDLIDRKVPVLIELGTAFKAGSISIYGQHTVVLVGYSDPYLDSATGEVREEYYLIDAEYPVQGAFGLFTNDADRDGDGTPEIFPGNRTMTRAEFRDQYQTKLYVPVFRSQAEHDSWYDQLRAAPRIPVVGWLNQRLFSGSFDMLTPGAGSHKRT